MNANEALHSLTRQITDLLEKIQPEIYRQPLPEFEGSTLGQHFRHILEFFQCLQNGLERGLVDYAGRERNLLYEQHPGLATEAFERFDRALDSLDFQTLVLVRAEFGSCDRPEYPSTVGRELMFVYDHAIHHLAMIKVGLLCHFPELQGPRDLGVSPSTLKFRQALMS